MPSLHLSANVKPADTKAFVLEFAKFGAEMFQKPLAFMAVSFTYNEALSFGGTLEPAFALNVGSLDNLSHAENEAYSKALSAFLTEKLGLPNDRGYMTFHDPGTTHLGYKGTTFHTIFANMKS